MHLKVIRLRTGNLPSQILPHGCLSTRIKLNHLSPLPILCGSVWNYVNVGTRLLSAYNRQLEYISTLADPVGILIRLTEVHKG